MAANIESDIDQLYTLPLTEFTRARNTLAKDLAGEAGKKVRALGKPSVPAWAVNQLYWQDRATYEALVKAAEQLRAAHRAVISGRKADLRKPTEAHRAAVQKALSQARTILKQAKLPDSSSTVNAMTRTLEALPTSGPPGRLAVPLQPTGFNIFAGVKPRADLRLVEKEVPKANRSVVSGSRLRGRAATARLAVALAKAVSRTVTGPSAQQLAKAKTALRAARKDAEKAVKALKAATAHADATRADEARHRTELDRAIQARHAREREVAALTTAANNAAANVAAAERALASLK